FLTGNRYLRGTAMTTPTAQAPAARADQLNKIYGDGPTRVTALDQVCLEIGTGTFTAIMGPSGSGKSTLMHCMAGLDSADGGQVWIGGTEITTLPERRLTRLRRDRVGFVFQAYNLLPALTAADNITLPLDIGPLRRPGLARHRGGHGGPGPAPAAPPRGTVRRAAAA